MIGQRIMSIQLSNMKIRTILLLLILFFFFTTNASAHSGRTDAYGCHNCNVGSCAGTYHCHNGGYIQRPVYVPPPTATPTPLQMRIVATYDLNETTCKYTVSTSWDKPTFYDQYSVSAVRSTANKCIDPGPIADTTNPSYIFSDLRSGNYLINVKPGNFIGWNHYYYCATIDLPLVQPRIQMEAVMENEQQYISYTAVCATSVTGDNGIGYLGPKQGKIKVAPKGTITYKLTAVSADGVKEERSIILTDATPTPIPTFTPIPSNFKNKGFWEMLFNWFID